MTTSSEILTTSLEMIKEQFPNIWAVYQFGSFGTEYERADSDLDLAILLKETADPVVLWDLAQKIARKINRDVDLVDLRQVSTVFQNEIIRNEKRIYCSHPKECDFLESCYLAMYLRLNEERKEILDDLKGSQNG